MTCTAGHSNVACVATVTSTPAFDGLLDLNAINSDGFQLITDDQLPVDLTVFWEAWGGSDIAAANVISGGLNESTGTVNVTHGVGGTPSVLMFAGCNADITVVERNDSGLSVGFSTGTADADNVVVAGNNDDGSASADTDGYGRAGDCIAFITNGGGNPDARAKVTNFASSATQFQITWTGGGISNRQSICLAIRGGNWKAGGLTINGNSGGATATVSGLAFQPKGVSLIGRMTTESAAGTSTAQDRIALGSGSSTSSRRAMGALDEDGTANCEVDHVIEYDQVLAYPSTAGALAAALDINAINSDGFQLIVDTAGGVASEWVGYLTFGNLGTTFTQSASGTVTSSGALVRQARKGLSGTVSSAGALLKQTARNLTGTLTTAASVAREIRTTLIGTVTTAGTLTGVRTVLVALAATLTSSGAIVKETARAGLAGTVTTVGSLSRQTSRAVIGTLTTAGALTRQAHKALAGAVSSSGAIVKETARAGLAGTVTTIGSLSRQTSRAVVGTLTTAGTLTRQAHKALAGAVSASGAIVKQTARAGLAAALTSAGALATQLISGAQTFFLSVSSTLTTVGALSRRTDKLTAGTVTTAGTLTRQARKLFAGALTSAGDLVGELVAAGQTFFQSLTATLAAAGDVSRLTGKQTDGTVTSAGALSRMTAHGVAATLAPSGALVKQTARALSSVLSFVATLLERLFGPRPPVTPHVRVIVRPDVSRVIVPSEPRRVIVAADVSRVMVARDVRTIIARPDVGEVL